MGGKLTFENYLPGDSRELDPKWQEKYGYRVDEYRKMPDPLMTYEEKMRIRDLNAAQQQKRTRYADGLHGYEYYSMAGQRKTEYQAMKERFDASIPADRWVISDSVEVKTAAQDRKEIFDRLEAIQPPAFMNKDVTADMKEGMSTDWKKKIKKQLDDYKEMRANWEETDRGREWKEKVQRLKDMEEGRLVPDEGQNLQISAPSGMKKYIRNPEHVQGVVMDTSKVGKVNMDRDLHRYERDEAAIQASFEPRAGMAEEMKRLDKKYNGEGYMQDEAGYTAYRSDLQDSEASFVLHGIVPSHLMLNLSRSLGQGMDGQAVEKLFDKLMAPHRADLDMSDNAAVIMADHEFESGVKDLKRIIYGHLKRLEATYGTLPTQLKADDFLRMAPEEVFDHFAFLQDTAILMRDAAKFFDFAKSDEDREFKRLFDYYERSWQMIRLFLKADYKASLATEQDHTPQYEALTIVTDAIMKEKEAKKLSADVGGPHLEEQEEEDYINAVKNRVSPFDTGNMFSYEDSFYY